MNNKNILITGLVVGAVLIGVIAGFALKPKETVKIKEIINAQGEVVAGVNIAVVDDVMVMERAKAYVALRAEYQQKMDDFKVRAEKEREKLKKMNDEIAAKRSTLSQAEFDLEVEKFAKKQAEAASKFGEEGKKIEAAYVDAMKYIRENGIDAVLKDIAKEQGVSVIVSKMVVLVYDDSLDITEEVIKKLDAKMPKAKIGLK